MQTTLTPIESPIEIPTTIIAPTRGWTSLGLRDVWEYRELLYFLLWREVQGNYRQMALGPLWMLINPVMQMIIYTLIFSVIAKLPSEGIPYPVFTFVALLPWQFFVTAASRATGSLRSQQHIISKIYFPRLVIPLSGMLAALVDFAMSFVILIIMLLIYRVPVSWQLVYLPLFLLLAGVTGLAIGLWLACLAIKFHDVSVALGHVLNVWKYATPVAYSITLIPERWQFLYRLNPMTVVVEGFRWALLGTGSPPGVSILIPVGAVLVLLITGAFYFRRTERTIVDVI